MGAVMGSMMRSMGAVMGRVHGVIPSIAALAVAVALLVVEVGVNVSISESLGRVVAVVARLVSVISIVSTKPVHIHGGGAVRGINLSAVAITIILTFCSIQQLISLRIFTYAVCHQQT